MTIIEKDDSLFKSLKLKFARNYSLKLINDDILNIDIEELIKKVKKKVYDKTGEDLELEIKIIGE